MKGGMAKPGEAMSFFAAFVVLTCIPTGSPFELSLRLMPSSLGQGSPPAAAARPSNFLVPNKRKFSPSLRMQTTPEEGSPEPRYQHLCPVVYFRLVEPDFVSRLNVYALAEN